MEAFNAQMAELVDALVSNTNEVTLVPVRLRLWVQRLAVMQAFFVFQDYSLFNPQPDKISFAVQLGELWTVVC
jgi:hypothetical protein